MTTLDPQFVLPVADELDLLTAPNPLAAFAPLGESSERLRIFTWHVHGNYLYYLSQCPHDFYVPVKPDHPEGYGGRLPGFPWPDNLHDVPAEQVQDLEFDCVLFQSRRNWQVDQHEVLSEAQRQLPRLYLEHDPPLQHPTDTRHPMDDPAVTVVHVTDYNRLMWDCGTAPTCTIDHGVLLPEGVTYEGDLPRAVAVVNNLPRRGRRLGVDVFEALRSRVPIDLIGMGSEALGGLGEVPHAELPAVLARYRVFVSPIRYSSLSLAVCEAMTLGLPVVGLATTELVTVVNNGVSGYLETSVDLLAQRVADLLDDPAKARAMGEAGQVYAQVRFALPRFVHNWDMAFRATAGVTSRATPLGRTLR